MLRRTGGPPGLAALILALWVPTAQAQCEPLPSTPPPGFDRVEEDWELVIAAPDIEAVGPQITTTLSPVADNARGFVATNLNYRDSPFRAGGLQVQAWVDGTQRGASDADHTEQLANDEETVAWTQVMWTGGGRINFGIINGNSTTWGRFGEGCNLNIGLDCDAANLDAYSPAYSVANSGVGWQADRVRSMSLVRVRYYAQGTLVAIDQAARPVPLAPAAGDGG